jgi:tetratricopeptide (TPR) repeat protein
MFTALVPLFVAATGTRRQQTHAPLPESAVAEEWLRLGTHAACEGNREDARYYFVQAVRSDLDNTRAWLYLGGVADDPALTLSCMLKVLQLDPPNTDARAGLVWARNRLGLLPPPPPAPLPTLGLLVASAPTVSVEPPPPETSDSLLRRGLRAANDGDPARARYYFLRAIALDSSNTQAWLYLGGIASDPALTLAAMEQVLAVEPHNRKAYEGALWARNKLGLAAVGQHWWQN